MITYTSKCMKCQKDMVVAIGQIIQLDDIYWFRSWRCPHCGLSIEEDEQGKNDEIRKLIINSEGLWGLFLDCSEVSTVSLKNLRECFYFSIAEIQAIKLNSSKAIYTGTEKEVNFYEVKLKEKGVKLRSNKIC